MDLKMWSVLLREQNKLRIFEEEGYDREDRVSNRGLYSTA
jgi:hypothetical protein